MNRKRLARWLLPLVLSLATLLTGCVDYDVGVNFVTPYRGEIVQQIKVDEKLTILAASETRKWLNSIEKRSRQLKGKVKKLNSQELLLTIPFGNGKELAQKFNQLFQTSIVPDTTLPDEQAELIQLNSQVDLAQSNLIFVERNRIDLTIDLRALAVLTQQDKITIEPDSLANLKFQLNTPWIASSLSGSEYLQPISKIPNKSLVWQLHPGEINHIRAVFWLPSPIGIGTVIIIFLMLLGFLVKYRRFPGLA